MKLQVGDVLRIDNDDQIPVSHKLQNLILIEWGNGIFLKVIIDSVELSQMSSISPSLLAC